METLIRVLIADSGEDFRTLMREAVDQEPDMQVVATAADGVDALALITECKPDVILLGLAMPRLDGLEVLRQLPQTGVNCAAIVVSGFVNDRIVAECWSWGRATSCRSRAIRRRCLRVFA